MMGKEILIQYHAALREARGVSEETILTSAANPRELYEQLQKLHALPSSIDEMAVAVNHQVMPWNTTIQAQDTVVFLPPFSRG